MYPLLQAGFGRYSNIYERYKESIAPPEKPGGGGWNIFRLSLSDLYREHETLKNWWTKTNKHLNLCRYNGVILTFYRQQHTDYVVNYDIQYPLEVTHLNYMSAHPERLLMFHKKIVVPSMITAPHKKKPYIKKKIRPPKQFTNKWYFQSEFSNFPLIMITCAACSLNQYFISDRAENNTVHMWSVNTNIFKHKDFKQQNHQTFGYYPNASYYLYAEPNGSSTETTGPLLSDLIYLGNTQTLQIGQPSSTGTFINSTDPTYPFQQWGNPFHYDYIDKTRTLWLSQAQPTTIYTGKSHLKEPVTNVTKMTSDILTLCSYNPMKDKGYGNEAYWVKNYYLENSWESVANPELKWTGYPLWVMLWGLEDWTLKTQKLQHLETDYILVVKSSYITPQLPYYVFVSDSFKNGQGPYFTPRDETTDFYKKNWYPCWQYQKEAIENLLMSGPGVCKNNTQIQAHMFYDFLFKWGGTPTYVEPVADPVQQPDYALPHKEQQTLEIENPENDPTKELYSFDIRRDYITKTAAERITKDSKIDFSLFTDGIQSARSMPIQLCQKQTQKEKKKTPKTQKETLQQQLINLRIRRQLLRHRYYQLTKQLTNSKLDTPESE